MAGRHRHLIATTVNLDEERLVGLKRVSKATKVPVAALIRDGLSMVIEREKASGNLAEGGVRPPESIFETLAKEIEAIVIPSGMVSGPRAYQQALKDAASVLRVRSKAIIAERTKAYRKRMRDGDRSLLHKS